MFYCDNCRKDKEWPKSIITSYGPCEICKVPSHCHDISSSCLIDNNKFD